MWTLSGNPALNTDLADLDLISMGILDWRCEKMKLLVVRRESVMKVNGLQAEHCAAMRTAASTRAGRRLMIGL